MKNQELTFSWCGNIDDVSPDRLIPVHRYYYSKGFVKGKQDLTSFGGRVKKKEQWAGIVDILLSEAELKQSVSFLNHDVQVFW